MLKDIEKYRFYLNKEVLVKVDRKLGEKHPNFDFIYTVNYGYIPNTLSEDGEEIDAYILGVFYPVDEFQGVCKAVICRFDDNENKLIVAPKDRNYTIEVLRNTISGYSSVDVSSSDINIINEEWKYVLLPVWSITYNDKEKGKIYYFSINGQTGKVIGNLPVDNKKLFTVGLGVFAVITTILLFISYFII